MKCIYCNNEIADEAKFCKFCGKSLVDAEVEVAQSSEEVATATESAPTPAPTKQLNLKLFVAAGVAAAVLIAGVITTSAIVNSPKSVLAKGFEKTAEALGKEFTDLSDGIPALSFFDEIYTTGKYSAETEIEDINIKVYSDMENKQFKASIGAMGLDNDVYITEKDVYVESDFVDGLYGFSFETLAEDVKGSALMELMEIDVDEYLDIVEQFESEDSLADLDALMKSYENQMKVVSEFGDEIVAGAEITKEDPVKVKIDGKSTELKTYKFYVPAEVLQSSLENLFAGFMADETYAGYYEELSEIWSAEYGYEVNIEDEIETAIDSIVEAYEDHLEDEDILISLHKGKVVRLSFGDDEEIVVSLGMEGKLLEEIVIEAFDEEMTMETVFEDGVLDIELEVEGDKVSIEYDVNESDDNFVISSEYEDIAFTLDSTEKDVLRFEYEDPYYEEKYEVVFEKDNFDSDWFKNEEYTNVLTLSEDELYEILFSFSGI